MEEDKIKIEKEADSIRWPILLLDIVIGILLMIIYFFVIGVLKVSAISGHTLQIPSTNEIYMYDCSSTTNCDGRSIPLQTTSEGLIETTQNLTVTQGETIDIYLVLNETLIQSNYYTINHYITLIGSGGVINTQYLIESVNKVSLVNRTSNWFTTITNGGTSTTLETDYYQYYTYVTIASFQADRNTNYLHSQIKFNQSGTYRLQYNGYILSYSGFVGMTQQNLQETVTNVVQQENATQTQAITENQNENTDNMIDSQKVCNNIFIDKNKITSDTDNKILNSNGELVVATGWGVTDYIEINSNGELTTETPFPVNTSTYSCFYNENKTLISCVNNRNTSTITIPNNTKFFRATIEKNSNRPTFNYSICQNGNQAMNQSLQDLADRANKTKEQLEATFEPEEPDTEDFDSYENKENQLYALVDSADTSNVDIEIDSNANGFIWDTITSLVTADPAITTLVISVLSAGILKLVLGR